MVHVPPCANALPAVGSSAHASAAAKHTLRFFMITPISDTKSRWRSPLRCLRKDALVEEATGKVRRRTALRKADYSARILYAFRKNTRTICTLPRHETLGLFAKRARM